MENYRSIRFLHSHPIGELLKRLAVEGNCDPSISIEGKLHAVQNLWFPSVLHRWVRVIFISKIKKLKNITVKKCFSMLSLY